MLRVSRIMSLAAAGLFASVLSAGATPWEITGGTAYTLPNFGAKVESFNPNAANSPTGANELSSLFTAGTTQVIVGGQLNLLVAVNSITFTYLGREAGAANSAFDVGTGGSAVLTTASSLGASVTTGPTGAASPLPFRFQSTYNGGTSVVNGGAANGARIAFLISPTNANIAYAFFDDGGGPQIGKCKTKDCDFDDMIIQIEVAPIPLPAAAWLILAGIGGLGLAARRRGAAA